jgi:hypothetical protein
MVFMILFYPKRFRTKFHPNLQTNAHPTITDTVLGLDGTQNPYFTITLCMFWP